MTDFKKGSNICFEYHHGEYYQGIVIKNLKNKIIIEITKKDTYTVFRDNFNFLVYEKINYDDSIERYSVNSEYEKKHIKII
jgi:hypothetical protein